MQIPENIKCVSTMRKSVTGNNSSKCILDAMKMVDIFLSGAEKKRISVV